LQIGFYHQEAPMSDNGLKKTLVIGAVIGAVITLGTALSMDVFFSDTLQGTWREAAQKDVAKMFGPVCGRNWFAVTLVLVFVMSFLAGFGALLGIVAAAVVNRFFRLLIR
jgi:hypothetical protein